MDKSDFAKRLANKGAAIGLLPENWRRRNRKPASAEQQEKSLEIYQHLSLESVQKAYQDVVKTISV